MDKNTLEMIFNPIITFLVYRKINTQSFKTFDIQI